MAFNSNPTQWVSNQAYTKGNEAQHKGVNYKATDDITSTTSPAIDGVNWEVVSVSKIQDYGSLVEAIRLQLNVQTKPEIYNSVPMFIQLAEESFKMRLRPPSSRKTVTVTLDSDGKFAVPGDLVQVINLRVLEAATGSIDVFRNATVEILNANYEEMQSLRQHFTGSYTGSISQFEAPLYWFDNRHFWIAPTYAAGTTIELVYYKSINTLGTVINITNAAGDPINAVGQTSAEWVAAGGSNTAENFVQNQLIVENNWYLSAAPQLMLYGALLKSQAFVKSSPDALNTWKELYAEAESELMDFIATFEDNQAHTVQIDSIYF